MISTQTYAWFAEQVSSLTDTMFRVSYVLLHNRADCEDAIQEAVLRAYERLPQLRDRTRFPAWLMVILRRCCYDIMRRRQETLPLDEELTPGEAAALPIENLDLARALGALKPDSRVMLVLYYTEGYTQKEIAEAMNMPPGTVASKLSRARKDLKNLLTEVDVI